MYAVKCGICVGSAWDLASCFLFFSLTTNNIEGYSMSTRMEGITQPSLFSFGTLRLDVVVPEGDRYRILAENLPWPEMGEAANEFRSRKVDINIGRPLNLRMHLGALIAQSMNRWTDRETQEMVAYHAGVRLLCGLEQSAETIDHTNIECFRNQLGPEGLERLNQIAVKSAKAAGFTDTRLCSSDTTVQEAPIAYPTEVGHMKNIGEKLLGIGLGIRKGLSQKLQVLSQKAGRLFTRIRLFTRGEGEKVRAKKKKLSMKLHRTVSKMRRLVNGEIKLMGDHSSGQYQESLMLFKKMLRQIKQWLRTGIHPTGKIVSLWLTDARAITRNKAGKMTEFGRRWIITRLTKGYIIGTVCKRLGGGSDTGLMPQILANFESIMGSMPDTVVYDRGGDGPLNHSTLKKAGIRNSIFRKGRESLPGVGRNKRLQAKRERALSEATIATIKNPRYGFNKPLAKSSLGCVLKGHTAIFGANLTHLTRDWAMMMSIA